MERAGKIHIYMGDGKGKTTAAAGLAVRCAGHGGKVLFGQFLKDQSSGELASFEDIDEIQMLPSPGYYGFTWEMSEQDKEDAKEMYARFMDNLVFYAQQGTYRLIVLDEVIAAVEAALLDEDALIEWIEALPEDTEIVLTGRHPSDRLIEMADYVTEMKKIKHPYDKGLRARKGIEY